MPSSIWENQLKYYLKLKYPNYSFFYNYRPNWLKNEKTGENLELDIYCRELNQGWEFQGWQHYRDEKQVERDKIKKKLCRQMGVKLSAVTLKQLEKWLKPVLKKENSKYKDLAKNVSSYAKVSREKFNDITAKRRKPAIKTDKNFKFK